MATPYSSPPGRPAALFDVDETLVVLRSMLRFLAYQRAAAGRPAAEYELVERRMRSMVAAGVPREEVNRAYYRLFAGHRVSDLMALGEQWFAAEQARGEVFHPAAYQALRGHARDGHLTVLVSGSLPACLVPIARAAGADLTLCTEQEVRAGRYTGELVTPMIGEHKATAVRALAAERGLDLAGSYAYGDHPSDLPMLELVGCPVVVGGDPEMVGTAARRGWARLPAAPVAVPVRGRS